MRLMQLERHLEQQSSVDDEDFEDAEAIKTEAEISAKRPSFLPPNPSETGQSSIVIPPTIPEGEE